VEKNWKLILGGLVLLILVVVFIILPLAISPRSELSNLAQDWQDAGSYITWTSNIPANAKFGELNVFTIQKGDPTNHGIVFIHGYPTSSFDFTDLFDLLSTDYYVCAIDTPGYGLSDKPRDGYIYSIKDDAQLADYYIRDVLNLMRPSIIVKYISELDFF
jgi:pimeloyl-ACP methyl ester carboxylesterase